LLRADAYLRISTAGPGGAMSQTIFDFFGLRENPFKINPDPRFLFITDEARATAAELAYAIRTRKGLIVLTGEVGTGKTMLIRRLLDWLAEQKMPAALIFNSHIKPDHLLDFILNDFAIPCASNRKSEKLLALHGWLLERYRAAQTPVLIVDEAQGLDPAALEEIRLLLNLETPREKLLQIILAGQPELDIKLKRHELRQLRQRITIRCRTASLTLEQTHGYIRERLRVAGANGNPIFEPDALGCIHAYSRGIPRVINVLCEHSLINACADDIRTISPDSVERAARDCQLDRADTVARILNTGSYSTTSLVDIGSIVASVSTKSSPLAEPISQPESLPANYEDSHQPLQPLPPAEQITAGNVAKNPSENSTAPKNDPLLAAAACDVQEPFPPSQMAPFQSQSDVHHPPLTRSRPSPLEFLRLCSASLAADAWATSRQFRRAMHSLVRWSNLFVRDRRSELHQVRIRVSQLLSDPRWRELHARAVSASQASWRAFKSAIPPWLNQHLGALNERMDIHQTEAHKRAQTSAATRANRRRAILSLRRWLHEPLPTEQKRTHGNQRH
jgi:general secretion pathway protein A